MIRKLEHADLLTGALIEVKPKSTRFSPGKLFSVISGGRAFSGVSYTTHYVIRENESGKTYNGWPISLIRQYFHKAK